MDWMLVLAAAALLLSIWLMIEGAEKFTEGLLKTSAAFGVSTFALGFLFSGFDPDNLAVGVTGAVQNLPGVSMGTVIGSATFLLTVVGGATAVLHPLETRTPRRLIVLTLLSPIPLAGLALDGVLSRVDGGVLLATSLVLIWYVLRTARSHPLYALKERKVATAEMGGRPRWWPVFLMVGGVVAIVVGAELFGWGIRRVLASFRLDDTTFGMIAVAAAVSFEELPRLLIPARRGHAEVSVGNLLGTITFFVLFNAGVIALVRPLVLDASVLRFYWPAMMAALAAVSVLLWRGRIGRVAGGVLLGGYVLYVGAAVWVGYRPVG